MAGQQQIKKQDLESVYQEYITQLFESVKNDYIFSHYRIGKSDDKKLLEVFLFEKYFCSDSCEFIDLFYKNMYNGEM